MKHWYIYLVCYERDNGAGWSNAGEDVRILETEEETTCFIVNHLNNNEIRIGTIWRFNKLHGSSKKMVPHLENMRIVLKEEMPDMLPPQRD